MKNSELSAFPVVLQHGLSHDSHVEIGLTKREYFAGKAMIMLAPQWDNMMMDKGKIEANEYAASQCILLADEILKRLNP